MANGRIVPLAAIREKSDAVARIAIADIIGRVGGRNILYRSSRHRADSGSDFQVAADFAEAEFKPVAFHSAPGNADRYVAIRFGLFPETEFVVVQELARGN